MLTAEERIKSVLNDIVKNHQFSEEQMQWLSYIREHLIINLAIEPDNFDIVPVLERHGGLSKARKIFGSELQKLIEEINYKITA